MDLFMQFFEKLIIISNIIIVTLVAVAYNYFKIVLIKYSTIAISYYVVYVTYVATINNCIIKKMRKI